MLNTGNILRQNEIRTTLFSYKLNSPKKLSSALSTLEKSLKGLRIAEIILGAIAIALSAAVLANPDVTTLLFVTLLGIALIMVGISRIIVGVAAKQVSKGFRGISIGIGVVSIVGGSYALVNPVAAVVTLVTIIAIIVLIHGLGLIATGFDSRVIDKLSLIGYFALGAISVGFGCILFAYPGLAVVMTILLVSIGLLFNGIASIISGITGNTRLSPITK